METYTTFSEYLKSVKYRPLKGNQKRQIERSMRATRRDEMLATKRTFSPMPITPFKPNGQSTMIQSAAKTSTTRSTRRAAAASEQERASSMKNPKVVDRMAKLKKWREERANRLAMEKARQKPLFKAAVHVDHLPASAPGPPLASRNHKFKAPANIKPIVFHNALEATAKESKVARAATRATNPKLASIPQVKVTQAEDKPVLAPRRKLNFQVETEKKGANPNTKAAKTTTVKDSKTKVVPAPPRITRQTKAQPIPAKPATKIESKIKSTRSKTTKNVVQLDQVAKVSKEKPQKKSVRMLSNIEEFTENEVDRKNKENEIQVEDVKPRARKNASPTKTPRRKSLRTLSESNQQNLVEDVRDEAEEQKVEEAKGKKSTRFKTPPKTPTKTPTKTPKAMKSRKSAGRTPRRRLNKMEIDVDANVEEDHTETPDINRSQSVVYPCETFDSTFTLDEPSVAAFSVSHTDEEKFKTPEERGDVPMYVSPFVTLSRGKKSARSEYKSRASKGGECATSPESTGIKAAAAYFNKLLDSEIARIQGLCEKWEKYKSLENPPEEACNMISVPIGQSNLLITKKMQQFRALIDKSLLCTDGLSVTCTDLHGFWDTVMIQVANVDQRFENLDRLRDNQWLEVLPLPKVQVAQLADMRVGGKPRRAMPSRGVKTAAAAAAAKPAANSKIRDAIKAARANRNRTHLDVGADGAEFNGGFFSIKSPVKQATPLMAAPRKTPRRETGTTLLKSVLHAESRKSMRASPGLAMMKASQNARRSDGDFAGLSTPTKSILKLSSPRSSVKKAVLFKELEAEVLVFDEEDPEEDTTIPRNSSGNS